MTERHVGGMTVYVRITLAPEQLFAAVRAKVRALDSRLPIYGMTTLDEQVSRSLLVERLIAACPPFWIPGDAAGSHRALWGDGLHCGAEDARDRDSDGAGAFQKHVICMVMRVKSGDRILIPRLSGWEIGN
jgi:hypothetical protein